ncbi:XkdX family protein [Marvinbryantia formatexigens DSM 14469]|uniref:XkdX family protein n=1 Tax=Marvinbryantia formatexigens DSM 14469 TaxID=478749 RepID=C6LG77_9FIRM|nr:XkdX family protein [Marvinbryantia formatexigens]EET60441.1 XkdX family protein [Marvinbryantia formatexigens DSM 14469]UWO25220.1 XkdX family protein [Marvinbryantia formatexigens DSM 14469]SDH05544.1 phage uncharacterized protein, XkdX family [Marvinbryantia formatexigens]
MFEIIKRYYNKGLYSDGNLAVFVTAGKITAEQYAEITGKEYTPEIQPDTRTGMQLLQEQISELRQNQEALLAGANLLTGGAEDE